jgi:hypothetical protein
MRKRVVWSAVVAMVMAGQALADGMSYNYLQGGALGTQIKAGGDSDGGAGFRLEGAISNNMPMYAFFNLSSNKYSGGSDNLKLVNASAGVGGHLPLSSSLDFVGSISYESVRLTPHISFSTPAPPQPSPDSNPSRGGVGLAAGVRGQVGTKIEWTAGIKYRDIARIKSILGASVGGRYFLTPALALGVDVSGQKYSKNTLDATESMVAFSVRYQFSDPW